MLSPDDPVLMLADAARLIHCSESTLYKLVQRREIPAIKCGGWRILRKALLEWVAGETPDTESQPEAAEVRSAEPKRQPKGIIYAVETAPGRVKLGYTTNLPKRLHAIEGNAGQATLLRSEPGTVTLERRLHAACKDHYIRREHFRNEGRVAEYVAGAFSAHDLPNEVSP